MIYSSKQAEVPRSDPQYKTQCSVITSLFFSAMVKDCVLHGAMLLVVRVGRIFALNPLSIQRKGNVARATMVPEYYRLLHSLFLFSFFGKSEEFVQIYSCDKVSEDIFLDMKLFNY